MSRAAGSASPRARRTTAAPTSTAPVVREMRARGRDTMSRLLDAGAEVFAARGYHATRVDDIVKLAHTSHGTFYLYFANKDELFRALAGEVAGEMAALADRLGPLQPTDEGRAELRAWIEQFVDLYERHGPVIRAWTEAEIGGSEFGRLGTDVLTLFTRGLYRRVAQAAPPGLDPEIASLALVAMFERLNYYAVTRQARVERTAMIDTLTRVTHASLFGS
ncbi:MAG TPA: TetR/AcrR family transcriptional regulator [Acidimicrobiia bacterium]|nr:TetR/AcrR family transcriptional regulator [Acidimicrobiia bacterium]